MRSSGKHCERSLGSARTRPPPQWVRWSAEGGARAQGPAEEALWHFPLEQAHGQLLDLLGHRAFVMANPKTVVRLIDRAGRSPGHGLEPALTELVPFRFRFWNPALRRVGARARALLQHS